MTITSIRTLVLASTPRTARSITVASLNAGIITVTKRSGSIAGKTVRPSRRAWISASSDKAMARKMPIEMAKRKIQPSATTEKPSVSKMNRSVSAAALSPAESTGIDWSRVSPASVETGTKV